MGAREVSTPGRDSYRVGRKVPNCPPALGGQPLTRLIPILLNCCKSRFPTCTEGPRSYFFTERAQRALRVWDPPPSNGSQRQRPPLGNHGSPRRVFLLTQLLPTILVTLHRNICSHRPADGTRRHRACPPEIPCQHCGQHHRAPPPPGHGGHSGKNPWVTSRRAPQTFPRT